MGSPFHISYILCFPQAAQLDEYVSSHKAASRQKAGATCWLVTQQQLEQETADCEAALGEALAPPPLQALLAQPEPSHQLLPQCRNSREKTFAERGESSLEDIDAALAALPSNLVPGAVALAGAVGQLLVAARGVPLQPETVGEIRGHLTALQAEVATACQQLGALTQLLHQNARRLAASGAAPVLGGRAAALSLTVDLQELYRAHPLADPTVKQHLIEEAASLEAAHAQRRQQRAAAYKAFLQGQTGDSSRVGGDYQSGCLSSSGSGEEVEKDSPELQYCGLELGAQEDSCSGSSDGGTSLQGAALSGALPTPRLLLDNSTCGSCPLGEWSKEEQEAFARIKQDCLAECGGSAGGQAAVLERMHSRLPGKSVEQLRTYWQWQVEAGRLRSAVVQLDRGEAEQLCSARSRRE